MKRADPSGGGVLALRTSDRGHPRRSWREKLWSESKKRMSKKIRSALDRADPRDVAYYKARLEDPSLLDRAVLIAGLLAVPVGGKRRGGYVGLEDFETSEKAIGRLARIEGFPHPRYQSKIPA